MSMSGYSVLFVCLGNICRSPLAEGVMRFQLEQAGLAADMLVDSAGTGGWHEGELPDRRSIAIAAQYGIDLTPLRARQVRQRDFSAFTLILGMDESNVASLKRIAPDEAKSRIHLFSNYTSGQNFDVPDPYYGGPEGFEKVYQMLSEECISLVDRLKSSDMSLSGKTSSVI
jgi:protein-tyrosine phosphatase